MTTTTHDEVAEQHRPRRPTIDEAKVEAFATKIVDRPRHRPQHAARLPRRPARPLARPGRAPRQHQHRAGAAPGLRRALRAGVAGRPGGRRLRDLRPGHAVVHPAGRARAGPRRRGRPGLHGLRLRGARLGVGRPSTSWRTGTPAARASAGTSTTRGCSSASSGSSGRRSATSWSPSGCRRCRAWSTGSRRASASSTSAAGWARRRIAMAEAFPASTFVGVDYHEESVRRAGVAANGAGVADRVDLRGRRGPGLRGHLRPHLHVRHAARPRRPGRRAGARQGAPGRGRLVLRASSPTRATGSRTTCTRSGWSGTPPATTCACRTRSRRAVRRSATRPVRRGPCRSSRTAGSPTPARSRSRRSTW